MVFNVAQHTLELQASDASLHMACTNLELPTILGSFQIAESNTALRQCIFLLSKRRVVSPILFRRRCRAHFVTPSGSLWFFLLLFLRVLPTCCFLLLRSFGVKLGDYGCSCILYILFCRFTSVVYLEDEVLEAV